MKRFSFLLTMLVAACTAAWAQDLKLPALSPHAKMEQAFSTSSIEIDYSRPSMRGRKVFGELVAYGSVWRTGANSATKVKFGEDVMIDGKSIKAGEYALYTIPGASQWEIIFNTGVSNWGNSGFDRKDDVASFKVSPKMMNDNVQTFTINIADITFNSCNIELMWEKTKVVIPVKADNEARISASIDKAVNNPTLPYFQAANYYFEVEDYKKSEEYVSKAVEQNPQAFYMWALKARVAQKLNKKKDAIEAANRSTELAKGTPYEDEYARNNKRVIDAMK